MEISDYFDSRMSGLTAELPTIDPNSFVNTIFKPLTTEQDLETALADAHDGLVALKPTDAPHLCLLGIGDQTYVLDVLKTGSAQAAADRRDIRFVVQDAYSSRRALLDLGLTRPAECIRSQCCAMGMTEPGRELLITDMVPAYQENAAELDRRACTGWYGRIRNAQDMAVTPGFRVDRARYEEILEQLATGENMEGTVTAWRKALKTCEGDILPVRYSPAEAITGRFQTKEPNVQGMPKELRQALFAPDGQVLISADYRQAHPRIIYCLSEDENLGKAFNEGIDIYRHIAALALGKQIADVTDADRDVGKVLSLGLSYGMGAESIAEKLSEAGIDNANELAPQFLEKMKAELQTFYAWKAHLRGSGSPYMTRAEYDKYTFGAILPSGRVVWYDARPKKGRKSRNPHCCYIVQGIEVEIMLDAIRQFAESLRMSHVEDAGLMLFLHDELVAYCNEKDAPRVKGILRNSMEQAFINYPRMKPMSDFVEVTGPSTCWRDLK